MNLAYSRLKKKFRRFNKHAFSWQDVLKICHRERINIVFMPLIDAVKGYYTTTLKTKYRKKYIVLNNKLSSLECLFVALHELIHHFLHVTDQRTQTYYCRATELIESKEETEAYALAMMMFIPKPQLIEMLEEDTEYWDPLRLDYFTQRKFLYQTYRSIEDQ